MTRAECRAFLQRALPRLGLQWRGYRRVHGIVCKRIGRRLAQLQLPDTAAYSAFLAACPGEWGCLEAMMRIPVSRFYRDRSVFAALERVVLPVLAAAAEAEGRRALDCWSACCASGEEPYTLAMLWRARLAASYPALYLRIVATDADAAMIRRGRAGCYAPSSVKELPEDLLRAGLEFRHGAYCVLPGARIVTFMQQDVRTTAPGPLYDLILCRNAVLTYFDARSQEQVMERVLTRLRPGGALVIGIHETLPARHAPALIAWDGSRPIYRMRTNG